MRSAGRSTTCARLAAADSAARGPTARHPPSGPAARRPARAPRARPSRSAARAARAGPPGPRRPPAPSSSPSSIPPSGPTTRRAPRTDASGNGSVGERGVRGLVQHERDAAVGTTSRDAAGEPAVVDSLRHGRQPRPARLLGRLAHGGEPRGAARAARSPRHTTTERCRLPRHDPVDTHLGRRLDRELVPVTLGERLDQHHAHRRRAPRRPRSATSSVQPPGLDPVITQPAAPRRRRRRRRRSPGRGRCTTPACRASVPSSTVRRRPARSRAEPAGLGEEDRAVTRQRPASLSRSLANTPELDRREPALGRSSSRSGGELAQQALLLLVERRGHLNLDVHVQVAAAHATCRWPTPSPRSMRTSPGCVPGRTSTVARPVERLQLRPPCPARPPSSGSRACSAGRHPCRMNVSCGRFAHLQVDVAGRAARRADLALAGAA